MPAFKPDPLSAVNVGKRVANGAEAGRQVTRELLGRKRGAGVNRAVIRPGVEIIEQANVVDIHPNGSFSIWVAPLEACVSQRRREQADVRGARMRSDSIPRPTESFRYGHPRNTRTLRVKC